MNIPPIQDKGGQGLLARLAVGFLTRFAEELAIHGANIIHDELRGLIQRRRQAAEQAAEDGGEDDDVAA